jgi:hypothetical protein
MAQIKRRRRWDKKIQLIRTRDWKEVSFVHGSKPYTAYRIIIALIKCSQTMGQDIKRYMNKTSCLLLIQWMKHYERSEIFVEQQQPK